MLGESDKSSFYFDDCCFSALGVLFDFTCEYIFLAIFILEFQGGVGEVCER